MEFLRVEVAEASSSRASALNAVSPPAVLLRLYRPLGLSMCQLTLYSLVTLGTYPPSKYCRTRDSPALVPYWLCRSRTTQRPWCHPPSRHDHRTDNVNNNAVSIHPRIPVPENLTSNTSLNGEDSITGKSELIPWACRAFGRERSTKVIPGYEEIPAYKYGSRTVEASAIRAGL